MAAQKDSLNITIQIDSSKVILQDFSENLSQKYNGKEFEYNTLEGETQNLLARAIDWLFNGLKDIFGIDISPEFAKLIENIIYILLIIVAIYFVIRVLTGKDAVSFFKNKNNLVAPIHITEEHIENIDLNELITNALSEKNYRLAIRYMYLKALQDLSIKNIIQYHFEKTNTDYYKEITDSSLKTNFNRISYLYDYIWYGEFDLDEEGYQNAKKSFDQLHTKMNSLG
ncbi:DUF4129 domain-containing protein [Aquimarina muelleri]|uniref:DUF4129 domain-containing protein n=1 Tax=Aquimarina muelleri TaxID=279356 RepID=A0A918N5T5_9FLAO|nr:DUF4129 domain-containing protein [Aquimarina muelleri]MCX2764169.1 DUF4129 domain-containing protein [Aquimarina muelleri]GGX31644.1 hypothetical protein GCM10007384_35820 [Aquimarina muelleri]